jgi:PD-(D/E)XK nuclease superfamily protein
VLTTDQKGAIAEAEIALAAVRLGIGVFEPVIDGERYDYVFDLRPQLIRVQCKWARRYGEVVVVRCYSVRRGPNGLTERSYSPEEVDAFAAYCAELDTCYFLPIARFAQHKRIQLRLSPTRNNQKLHIHWASDFEFAATLGQLGAIAQLGERQSGTLEVAGSSPAGSMQDGAREFPRPVLFSND